MVVTKGTGTPWALWKKTSHQLRKLGISGRGHLTIGENAVKLVYSSTASTASLGYYASNRECWSASRHCAKEGVGQLVGFSTTHDVPEIKEALDTGIFDVGSYLTTFSTAAGRRRRTQRAAYAHQKQVGIINMKAFGGNSTRLSTTY